MTDLLARAQELAARLDECGAEVVEMQDERDAVLARLHEVEAERDTEQERAEGWSNVAASYLIERDSLLARLHEVEAELEREHREHLTSVDTLSESLIKADNRLHEVEAERDRSGRKLRKASRLLHERSPHGGTYEECAPCAEWREATIEDDAEGRASAYAMSTLEAWADRDAALADAITPQQRAVLEAAVALRRLRLGYFEGSLTRSPSTFAESVAWAESTMHDLDAAVDALLEAER